MAVGWTQAGSPSLCAALAKSRKERRSERDFAAEQGALVAMVAV